MHSEQECNCYEMVHHIIMRLLLYSRYRFLQSQAKLDHGKLLKFWLIYASLDLVEYFLHDVFDGLLIYWLAKCILLLLYWLLHSGKDEDMMQKRLRISNVGLKHSSTMFCIRVKMNIILIKSQTCNHMQRANGWFCLESLNLNSDRMESSVLPLNCMIHEYERS